MFRELQPDLVTPRYATDDAELRSTDRWLAERDRYYLRGLMTTPRFRDQYRLVTFKHGSDRYPVVIAHANRDWLGRHGARLRWTAYRAC